jgi:hypothetical protein
MFVDVGGCWEVNSRIAALLREEKRTQLVKNIRTNKTDSKRLKTGTDGLRHGRRPGREVRVGKDSRHQQPKSTAVQTQQTPKT